VVGRKLAEAIGLDMQGAVETRSQILERNHSSQFNDLRGIEVSFQILKGRISDLCRRARYPLGIAEDCLFARVEIRAALELCKVGKLLFADALFSANGRINIDSKRASYNLCRAHAGERLEPWLDPLYSRERSSKSRVCLGNFWTVRERGKRDRHPTKPLCDLAV
jgi:hypothetical protein